MIRTLTLLSFALFASSASAQSGLGLFWDGCSADPHQDTRTFACDTNAGEAFSLYATVVVPAEMPQFTAASLTVDVGNWYSAPVPDWWRTAAGQCRENAITMTFDPVEVATPGCPDIWQGTFVMSAFAPQLLGSGEILRLRGAAAVQAGNEVHVFPDGAELVVCRIRISRQQTVGTGSCAGCTTCEMLALQECKLQQPPGYGDYTLTNGQYGWSNVAFWNGHCIPPDPVQNRSWGAIKGMYR